MFGLDSASRRILTISGFSFFAARGKDSIAQFLIEKGADVNAKNINGETSLKIAFKKNRSDIVELLESHGATISMIDQLMIKIDKML